MIEAFGKTIKALLKNPLVLVPAIALSIVSLYLSDLVSWPLAEAFIEFLLDLRGFEFGLIEGIVLFISIYAGLLVAVILLFFVSMTLTALAFIFYSKYAMHAGEKNAFKDSLAFSLAKIPRAMALVLSALLIALIANSVIFVLFIILPVGEISILFLVLLCLVEFFALFKMFLYACPAIALDDLNAKEALKKSWNFSFGKMIPSILAIIIVLLIASIVMQVAFIALELIEIEVLALLIAAFFNSIIFAFASFFFAFYFFGHQHEEQRTKRKRK